MPRFVILRHETPPGYERPTHFDLLLEWGDTLRTWALPAFPTPGVQLPCEELAPHRREYLDYEGAVSTGRGSVTQVAAGAYDLLEQSSQLVRVRLHGTKLSGLLCLTRQEPASALWTATFSAA
jgi:hypothetical protein